jgi:predicted AAA+ superfamily ATPase
MKELSRLLDLDLPPGQSAFLWGARKVGKTTFLNARFPESLRFDFLQTELHMEILTRPHVLREQLIAGREEIGIRPVILDEVQKVPTLLDEVHWLIENEKIGFILCGSSARKLKRWQANLLGDRAWRYEMLPLVSSEITDFDLLRALNRGLIPSHYLAPDARRFLRSYLNDYLKQEILDEGLTRNMPAFSRFLEAVGYSHGELINFANIARDTGVDSRTVREYYQILVDTLVGRYVEPYSRRSSRQVITRAAKFYLFDVGVAGAITDRRIPEARGEQFGKALEHFILMELAAHAAYTELDYRIRFWRTKSGQEVDFVLGDGEVAIEVNGSSRIDRTDLKGLKAFADDHKPKHSFVVCTEDQPRLTDDGIRILPWRHFLEKLWAGEIIN